MKSFEEIEKVTHAVGQAVSFRDWILVLHPGEWLQWRFPAPDIVSGEIEMQHGRKWKLSQYMTKSEIVLTALKAVLAAVEHEAREDFRYLGKAIFGPHFNVDALAGLAQSKHNLDMRTGEWVTQNG